MVDLPAEGITEDEIEKTDTIPAGLVYQYAAGDATYVAVFVSDTKAEQVIEDVLSAANVGYFTSVIEGRGFITDLVVDQFLS